MRNKKKWYKGIGAAALILAICIVIIPYFLLYIFTSTPVDRYKLVIGKSTMTRNVLEDRVTGCLYVEQKDGSREPLLIDGVQACKEN